MTTEEKKRKPEHGMHGELKDELIHLLSNELTSNAYNAQAHVHLDTLYHRLYSSQLAAEAEPLPQPGTMDSQLKAFLIHANALELTFNKLNYIAHVYLSLVASLAQYKPNPLSASRRSARAAPAYLPIDIWACGVENEGSAERVQRHLDGLEQVRHELSEEESRYKALEQQLSGVVTEEVEAVDVNAEVEACWKEVRSKVSDRVYRKFVDRKLGRMAEDIQRDFEEAFETTLEESFKARRESAVEAMQLYEKEMVSRPI